MVPLNAKFLTQPMKNMYRVAVIEIGSGAVRLLVADVSPGPQLRNVLTASQKIDVSGAVSASRANDNKILEISRIIDRFHLMALEARPTRIAAFGTEAVRRLEDSRLGPFRAVFPGFRVLSKTEEAELSFLAGVMEIPEACSSDTTSLVVDQGSGSMEVVVGVLKSQGSDIHDNRSYKLGTVELVSMMRRAGHFKEFRRALEKRFSEYKPLALTPLGRPIVLGSAATKLAWLAVRGPDLSKPYDPLKVHGRVMRLRDIDLLVNVAEINPIGASHVIQPQDPNGPEFERVISGLIALRVFLERENKSNFVVCCKGTRYGLVWKLAFADRILGNNSLVSK